MSKSDYHALLVLGSLTVIALLMLSLVVSVGATGLYILYKQESGASHQTIVSDAPATEVDVYNTPTDEVIPEIHLNENLRAESVFVESAGIELDPATLEPRNSFTLTSRVDPRNYMVWDDTVGFEVTLTGEGAEESTVDVNAYTSDGQPLEVNQDTVTIEPGQIRTVYVKTLGAKLQSGDTILVTASDGYHIRELEFTVNRVHDSNIKHTESGLDGCGSWALT